MTRRAIRLIVIVNGVGDAILALPLVRAVRRRWPDDRLMLLCQDELSEQLFADVGAEIIPVTVSGAPGQRVVALPDAALLPSHVEWLLNLNTFSGELDRFIVDHVTAVARRGFHPPFDSGAATIPAGTHWRDRNFMVAGIAADYSAEDRMLALTSSEVQEGEAFVAACAAGRRVYAVHADATGPDKAWPEPSWHALIDAAFAHQEAVPIVVGHLPPRVWAGLRPPVYDATHFSLRRTAAIIRSVDAFVGVDSSFAHIADAFAVPTVGLYGPVPPEEVGPIGLASRALRGATGRAREIEPAAVVDALEDALASDRTARPSG